MLLYFISSITGDGPEVTSESNHGQECVVGIFGCNEIQGLGQISQGIDVLYLSKIMGVHQIEISLETVIKSLLFSLGNVNLGFFSTI